MLNTQLNNPFSLEEVNIYLDISGIKSKELGFS